jgi:HSP20 family protein
MFSLIPWKKRSSGGNVKVWRDREDEFYPMVRFRNEFESLWDRFWNDWSRGLSRWEDDFHVGFDGGLQNKPNEYVFQAELPGFEPDEIDVKVSGNTLTVRAEHKDEEQGKDGGSYRCGSYQRYFTLPHGVDEQKIDARYHSGVLEVHLPRSEQAQGKRITVNAV